MCGGRIEDRGRPKEFAEAGYRLNRSIGGNAVDKRFPHLHFPPQWAAEIDFWPPGLNYC